MTCTFKKIQGDITKIRNTSLINITVIVFILFLNFYEGFVKIIRAFKKVKKNQNFLFFWFQFLIRGSSDEFYCLYWFSFFIETNTAINIMKLLLISNWPNLKILSIKDSFQGTRLRILLCSKAMIEPDNNKLLYRFLNQRYIKNNRGPLKKSFKN